VRKAGKSGPTSGTGSGTNQKSVLFHYFDKKGAILTDCFYWG
jgi:hypothetical protein